MRRLLLAALGAAGSLLMDLPALAQLSNTTSTFSGQVAATCEFNLPENIEMSYDGNFNRLIAFYEFELNTNQAEYNLSLSTVTVNKEPQPLGQEISPVAKVGFLYGKRYSNFLSATKTFGGDGIVESISSSLNQLRLEMQVKTNQMVDNRWEIPPGEYSYSVTITCLL